MSRTISILDFQEFQQRPDFKITLRDSFKRSLWVIPSTSVKGRLGCNHMLKTNSVTIMKVYMTSRTLDSFEGSRDCSLSREKRREANFKDCLGPGSLKELWGVWNHVFLWIRNKYMESAGKTRRHFHRWWSGCCTAGQGGKVAWWSTSGGALVLALVALVAWWASWSW